MKIGVILGSIREGRAGESVANWVMEATTGREAATYELIDLKEFNVPLLESSVVPGAANKQYDDENVTKWSQAIDACDAYILVTPEYNHSVPGGMKNAFDSLGSEWAGKPIAFVAYGAAGGTRSVEHWRTIVANFSMYDLRNQIDLNLFTEFGENGVQPNERRAGELEGILGELETITAQLNK
ncbi:NAD(P)H-dependent oxidoreductase [Corynebacterium breve]|uniref:NAD(P)H-dependent oxidoreductase n=1 Tax=Corynebacterium breve TaxID=3049799 RepID=A0ABY8VI94_9CORY|nr:NAD(P)H-dependent oxidoreductase [Corynebacterium breve]WIM68470.1 NAD(P)H-dependent oxidoreductase [Corynebacterium breve]